MLVVLPEEVYSTSAPTIPLVDSLTLTKDVAVVDEDTMDIGSLPN